MNGVLSFIHGNMECIDHFVCGIGNIFVTFHQETLRILKYNDLDVIGT